MTVTYHAGRRIQGLDADRTATQLPAGSVGGWVELGRTTLGGAGDNITVSSLPNKRYYMLLKSCKASVNTVYDQLRFNSDTGSNYAGRRNYAGGTDYLTTSTSFIEFGGYDVGIPWFDVSYVANYASKEKLVQGHAAWSNATGAATVPQRQEVTGKWANTSNAINEIIAYNNAAGDFATGSELVVLGWDPADTHTNNFWQELASVNASGDTLDTGTFTAKKYLWVQCYVDTSGGNVNNLLRFNGDTGSNYSARSSTNGSADSTQTSQSIIDWGQSTLVSGLTRFYNMFIINNASNEKLIISHKIDSNTAGASNAPDRTELVGKWANTSNQITRISADNSSSGNFGAKTIMKVWGAD